jgi:uncharacterized protein (TIRG00374 family)
MVYTFAFKALLSLVFLAILFLFIDLRNFVILFQSSKPLWICTAAVLGVALQVLSGFVQLRLLAYMKYKISLLSITQISMIGFSLGLCTPGKLGDYSQVALLRKHEIPSPVSFLLLTYLRLITLSFSLLLSGCALLYYSRKGEIAIPVFSGSYIFLVALLVILSLLVAKMAPQSTKLKVLYFLQLCLKTRGELFSLRAVLEALTLSIFKILCMAFVFVLCFRSYNYEIPLVDVILITAVLRLFVLIPVTISGLGLNEVGGVFLFSKLSNIPIEVASAAILTNTVLAYTLALTFFFGNWSVVFSLFEPSQREELS